MDNPTSASPSHTSGKPGLSGPAPVPPINGSLKHGYYDGQPITYVEVDGRALIEGDIILDKRRLSHSPLAKTSAFGASGQIVGGVGEERWPGNVIWYNIDPNIPNPQRIYNAMSVWSNNINKVFIEGPHAGVTDYINFVWHQDLCSSALGRKKGMQEITVPDWCDEAGMMHEIGHALGLIHEQNRPDRDSYINFNWNNLLTTYPCNSQYTMGTFGNGQNFALGNLDFASIMLYSPYACAINPDFPVMTRKDGTTWTPATYPSSLDISIMKKMYPRYEVYTPWAIRDVGAGAGSAMTTYVVTNTPASGGNYTLARHNSQFSRWDATSGSGVRIDVDPSGNPWVVKANGSIQRWTGSSWVTVGSMTGAKDIGIGSNGTVYILSSATMIGNNYSAYRWTGSTWSRITSGGGNRITVDNVGRPWVVNDTRELRRWDGSQWRTVMGLAKNVGIGSDGVVYVTYYGVLLRKTGTATQNSSAKDNVFIVMNSFSHLGYDDPVDPPYLTEVDGGSNDRYWVVDADDRIAPGDQRGIAGRGLAR